MVNGLVRQSMERQRLSEVGPQSVYSPESEQSVLGMVLSRHNEILDEIRDMVEKQDFFVPAHAEIYQAMCDLSDRLMDVDMMTVHQLLVDRKLDQVVGSPGILAECLNKGGFIPHLQTHVRAIKGKSLVRQLQLAMADIGSQMAVRAENPDELIDYANQRMSDVGSTRVSQSEENAAQLADKTFFVLHKMNTEKNPELGIYTQYPGLDKTLGSFKKGELILLAARPGIGKSALAINMKDKMAYSRPRADGEIEYPGHKTGFFGLEMTSEQVQRRSLSSLSGIGMTKIQRARLEPNELAKIKAISQQMKEFNGWFEDNPMISLAGIKSKSRKWVRRHGVEIIFIDYLQLINHQSDSRKRNESVAEISRGLKCLAKELNIPIVALSQLNRDTDEDKRPNLSNLRESGALEQDSDVVLMLHPKEKQEEGDHKKLLNYELIIAKQRNGPTGVINLQYMPSIVRFFYPNETKPTEEI